jgi:hypothetical protein
MDFFSVFMVLFPSPFYPHNKEGGRVEVVKTTLECILQAECIGHGIRKSAGTPSLVNPMAFGASPVVFFGLSANLKPKP